MGTWSGCPDYLGEERCCPEPVCNRSDPDCGSRKESPWFGYTHVHTDSRAFVLCSRFSQAIFRLCLMRSLTVEKLSSGRNLSFPQLKFCTFLPQTQDFISHRCEAPNPETPISKSTQGDEVFRYVRCYVLYVWLYSSTAKSKLRVNQP